MQKLPINVKSQQTVRKKAETTESRVSVSPLVDIYEEKEEIVMLVDVPGASKEQINIKVDNGIITISGESKIPVGGDLRYWEFNPCKYFRAFELSSEIDQERITADCNQGVLIIHLPKSERTKPREITVNVK